MEADASLIGAVRPGSSFSGGPAPQTDLNERKLATWLVRQPELRELLADANDRDVAASGSSEAKVIMLEKFSHGQSNPTYLVKSEQLRQPLVLRRKPFGRLLPSAHNIRREYDIMQALSRTAVPVPQMYAYCADVSVIGAEFFLMEYVVGRVFTDPDLPSLTAPEREVVFGELLRVLAILHSEDIAPETSIAQALHLPLPKRPPKSYLARHVLRWAQQYTASRTRPTPNLDRLASWLQERAMKVDDGTNLTLVHGDYRLDNLIFHPTQPRVLAVIDWELCAVGHPYADLATALLFLRLQESEKPNALPQALDRKELETHEGAVWSSMEQSLTETYARLRRQPYPLTAWGCFLAFAAFRNAAILEGVARRAADGNASSKNAAQTGALADVYSQMGLRIADEFDQHAVPRNASSKDTAASMDFDALLQRVRHFMDDEIYPAEAKFVLHAESDRRWKPWAHMEVLKQRAQVLNLWNLWLPVDLGGSLTARQYAEVAAVTGRSLIAAEVFNCSAPDTGNMELLLRYGNDAQKSRWLEPLLRGEIRSCFAMTEPDVASSDATNIASTITEQGDSLVLHGRKWWTSGAMDERCELCLFLGVSESEPANMSSRQHGRHSIVLLPFRSPGVHVERALSVFGVDDAPHGHAQVYFDHVRIPAKDAFLLGRGRGFEAAQRRLGAGRLHHCMRLVGMAERALELHVQRSLARVAFRRLLAEQGSTRSDIAKSRSTLEMVRLLCIDAAEKLDADGSSRDARKAIAMIKLVAPQAACEIIDRAIQVHGGLGVCQESILPRLWIGARSLRIADGPDEVHMETIAKMELRERARL